VGLTFFFTGRPRRPQKRKTNPHDFCRGKDSEKEKEESERTEMDQDCTLEYRRVMKKQLSTLRTSKRSRYKAGRRKGRNRPIRVIEKGA